uniref:Peptidase S1 domain-containing protein n=1 Tax=Anopheles epiroticus TaxID=199890 RepID=A0A182PSS7_9DIPT
CGVRTSRRQPRSNVSKLSTSANFSHSSLTPFVRNPKIMHGTPTVEGQYPWQVSLELLHPSFGFIGHWCGGVLIERNWVLSAAHCIHKYVSLLKRHSIIFIYVDEFKSILISLLLLSASSDLFNLPLPALWTVVLGEYDRRTESGFEQRIPVDKIILHEKYHNFKHDLVLLKLGKPANTSPNSRVRKICLPFADFKVNSMSFDPRPTQQSKPDLNSKPAYFFDNEQSDDLNVQSAPDHEGFNESESFPEPMPLRDDNFLRHFKKSLLEASPNSRAGRSRTARYMINHLVEERLRSNRTKSVLSSAQTASSTPDAASAGRFSRRLFALDTFKPANTQQWIGRNGRRWIESPFAGNVALANNAPSNRQHYRANLNSKFGNNRRRNDKFSHAPVYYRKEPNYRTDDAINPVSPEVNGPFENFASDAQMDHVSSASGMPDTSQYVDCLATGWGKSTIDDELTDVLLQTRAPIQSSKKCEEAYGDFIKLHRGHLCAGNLDGAGGTCVVCMSVVRE